MAEITRYTVDGYEWEEYQDADGEYVKHDAHASHLAEKDAEIARLTAELSRLKAPQPAEGERQFVVVSGGDGYQSEVVAESNVPDALHEVFCDCGKPHGECSEGYAAQYISDFLGTSKDGEEWETHYHFGNIRIHWALEDGYVEVRLVTKPVSLRAQQPQWISVSERMPPERADILYVVEGLDVQEPYVLRGERGWDGDSWFWCDMDGEYSDVGNDAPHSMVKLWMPLPAPPQPPTGSPEVAR